MNPVFGIHVGNSTACLAIHKQDDMKSSVEVMANNAGDRVTPTIVTITENENVIGTACKSLMTSLWNTTITGNKRRLDPGPSAVEPVNGGRHVTTEYRDGELNYVLPLPTRTEYMTPQDIATMIYRSLIEIARSALPPGEPDIEISCVMMVPTYFSEEARFKVRTAAESVGWEVLHIINEPSAAILGYNLLSEKMQPSSENVLVYRVGGKTCEATLIQIEFGLFEILESSFSSEVGGNLLVSSLTKYLAEEFYRKYRLDPRESHRSITKLTLAAENCLHVLSTIESANCFVESLCDGVDFSHTVSRARFESVLFPYLSTFSEPIDDVFRKMKMTPSDIDKVLLCGGPMKIPRLKKYISEIFKDGCTKVVSLPNGINYDEVLACGAARHAGAMAAAHMSDQFLPHSLEIPVLEFPVSVQVEGADCDEIEFVSGQPLPAHKKVTLSSIGDAVVIYFTQIENHPDSPPVTLKGEVKLENLEDPTEINVEIDSESGIRVSVPEAANESRHLHVLLYEQL